MKPGEIRQLSEDELALNLRNSEEELFSLRIEKHTGRLSNTARVRGVKRSIARLKTEMTARKKAAPAAEEQTS
jgi:large subunit ribosomal protein L29